MNIFTQQGEVFDKFGLYSRQKYMILRCVFTIWSLAGFTVVWTLLQHPSNDENLAPLPLWFFHCHDSWLISLLLNVRNYFRWQQSMNSVLESGNISLVAGNKNKWYINFVRNNT